jgi:high affinity Mn2+ porin
MSANAELIRRLSRFGKLSLAVAWLLRGMTTSAEAQLAETAPSAPPPEVSDSAAQLLPTFLGLGPNWNIATQATWIDQSHPAFHSPYEGPNSLQGESENQRTFSFSLFTGYRFSPDTEIYFDPEIFQGHGLSNTFGLAGFPNGEAIKAAYANLHYNTSRLYLRRTFGLGGETEKIPPDPQNVGGVYDVNRLTLTLGKFAANDLFDDNAYSHDPRSQFMNWSLWESAAWDYPADVTGYTAGLAAVWNRKDWDLRYGIFMVSAEPNGARLDYHLQDANGQILQLDRRYAVGELTGTLRPFVDWNRARMGNYADALASPDLGTALSQSRAYRSKEGFGMSWDQELTTELGAFARLSWDDGRAESDEFTEVDRSAAAGLSVKGGAWGRKDDSLGIAGVVNGIAPSHQAYLTAGGTEGIILGDGGLSYGPEEILETYYNLQVFRWLGLSPDFQYAVHPGYNRARGPVPIFAIRAHVEF